MSIIKKSHVIAFFAAMAMAATLAFASGCTQGNTDDAAPAPADEKYTFATGGESGTYYAFGGVLAQHATNNANLDITAVVGNGSEANIYQLQDGEAQFAFCQSDVMSYAYEGSTFDTFEEQGPSKDAFSVVAALYDEQVQIVTCNPDIKTIADLKGKTVSIGVTGSGVYFNAMDILNAYDITIDNIDPKYNNFADSANDLKDGKIDAAFIVAGAPTTAITDLSTSKTTYLISLDDEHADKLVEASPYYTKATIPANTYKGQDKDVVTVAVGAVILASNNVSNDAVYAFVKDIFDGAADEAAAEAHAKYAELSLENASAITSVPYHPGAAKYFAEQGFKVQEK